MHPVKAIAIGLLTWPVAEIVVFFCVAAAVGFASAIALLALTSLAGLFVLRHYGRRAPRVETPDGFIAASAWSGGLAPGLGGIFLLIPGFLSSALGVVLMFPLSRRWLLAGFQRVFAVRQQRRADPGVIDLEPDEWRPLPGDKLPPAEPGRKD